MEKLEKITRRNFIVLTGGAAAIALSYPAYNLAKRPRRIITFEQALAEPSLRQTYIDELVRMEFGQEAFKYVKNFIYDHDGSKARDESLPFLYQKLRDTSVDVQIQKVIKSRIGINNLVELYSFDNRFSFGDEEKRRMEIINFVNTPEGFADIKKLMWERALKDLLKYEVEYSLAGTVNYKINFGKSEKSNIYLYHSLFESSEEVFDRVKFTIHPSEEGILGR